MQVTIQVWLAGIKLPQAHMSMGYFRKFMENEKQVNFDLKNFEIHAIC